MDEKELIQQLREKVALSCKILAMLRLADSLGHTSARVPGTDKVVIKPKSSPQISSLAKMTAEDMIVVGPDGRLVEGEHTPPAEVQLHLQVLKARPDVGSVVHTHQRMSTAFGIAGREILPLQLDLSVGFKGIPTYPEADLVRTVEQGVEVARTLGESNACHLRGHGVVVVGRTVEEATGNAINLERLAEMNYIVAQLGSGMAISRDTLEGIRDAVQPLTGQWDYFRGLLE